jgi:hypothetical protein
MHARPGQQHFVFPLPVANEASNKNDIADVNATDDDKARSTYINDSASSSAGMNNGQGNDGNLKSIRSHYRSSSEIYLGPSAGGSLSQSFNETYDATSNPFEQYLAVQKNRASFSDAMSVADNMYGASSGLPTPTYLEFPDGQGHAQGWASESETQNTRRTGRRISDGIMDRVSKFEELAEAPEGPMTPSSQSANGKASLDRRASGLRIRQKQQSAMLT